MHGRGTRSDVHGDNATRATRRGPRYLACQGRSIMLPSLADMASVQAWAKLQSGAAMQQVLTFGIAGHVDHGKTTLVRALTGMETDRLEEERRRGISIELGFAWLDLPLPDGTEVRVGLVDMPGHERFVRRMISGAAAIDAVLLVVAADEGVMPQGREHLAICDLLGVGSGAIMLTKLDLADELLEELAIDDVAGLTEGTFLAQAPVLRFSARDPDRWLPDLRTGLGQLAHDLLREGGGQAAAAQRRPFRMAVDRSFTLHGRGTIATGTAATGRALGEAFVQIYPGEQRFRIRSIERHGETVQHFDAPGRLALNLAGAAVDDVPAGGVAAEPGSLFTTSRFDARLRLLSHVGRGLPRRQRALIHIGTTHAEGAITQLNGESLPPGEVGWVQVHLDRPLAVAAGECFVIRGSQVDPRHGQTLAGGIVLHPRPARHRLGDSAVIGALTDLGTGDLDDRLVALSRLAGIRGEIASDLVRLERAAPSAVDKALERILARGKLRRFGSGEPRYFAPETVTWLERRACEVVDETHTAQPEREGVERDELIRQVGGWLDGRALGQILDRLVRRGELVQEGRFLARSDFKPKRLAARDEVLPALLQALARHNLAAPKPAELIAQCGLPDVSLDEIELALRAGMKVGTIERIARDYYLPTQRLTTLIEQMIAEFGGQETFSTGDLKNLSGLTRKHLIPLAEFLDGRRITIRDPDGNRRFRAQALVAHAAGRSLLG